MDKMTELLKYLDDDRQVGVIQLPGCSAQIAGALTGISQYAGSRSDLVTAYTEFLQQQDVTHYFTLTCARRVSAARLYQYFNEWVNTLERWQRSPMGWFRADETRRLSGFRQPEIPLHFHGVLIKAKINTSSARGLWHELAGDADVQPYDPSRGAIPYCLKQAFHHCGNYDLGGNKKAFRPAIQ